MNDKLPNTELNPIGLNDFLRLELPPQEDILTPWLTTQGLAMIYAPRGVGKTHVALGIAYAVATGGEFLRWQAPKPRGVLYLDGEMPAKMMQERLKAIVAAHLAPRPMQEQAASTHRIRSTERFSGRQGKNYTVKGKGGLIREVLISDELAKQLEQLRLSQPRTIKDRTIHYAQHYAIAGGKNWSNSFTAASKRVLGWSHGAHGLRHSYAQTRMAELQQQHFMYDDALKIVSQELGHFRAEITEVYLR